MGKKSSAAAASKISAAASPAVSSTTAAQRSSILKSSFAPSNFQLRLFASVIQSFESQRLRIHDTSSGRLRCEHAARPGSKVTCLDWGYYGASYRENQVRKKRRRSHSNTENAVIAYGTSDSEICMFSPTEGKVVGRLAGAHDRGIRDFKFSHEDYNQGWSLGEDSDLVLWDLTRDQALRNISLPDSEITILTPSWPTTPQILCASSTPFAIDLNSEDNFSIKAFDSFKNPIHTLYRSGTDNSSNTEHFLAADRGRYINIYDIAQKSLVRTLVAGTEVESADFFNAASAAESNLAQQMLAVTTRDGGVELFAQPFVQPASINGDLKSSRKNLTKRASALIKLVSSDSKAKIVPILSASLQGPELLVASVDGGVDVSFQKVRWQDEGTGDLLFDGIKEVIRIRSVSALNSATMNGVKDMGKSYVDESTTVVVNGGEVSGSQGAAIDISSSEEDEADEEADSEDDEGEDAQDGAIVPAEDEDSDEDMVDAPENQPDDSNEDDEDVGKELSFGEMLASKQSGEIAIVDALQPESTTMALSGEGKLVLPSGMSLGTVLTQSLRTNDRNLLESCLHTTDADIVRNTIQRLDSSLAGILLSKLAERLASRPGRYGHLLTWVQWTCVAHGGALAAQPAVVKQLKVLSRVLNQRTKSLDNLLLLKGKLDMLDAQLTFRKQLKAQREAQRVDSSESGMIYIEGEADNWSSDEDSDGAAASSSKPKSKSRTQSRKALDDLVGEEESDDEAMPPANGVSESEEEEEDDEIVTADKKRDHIIDDEAELSGSEDTTSDENEGASDEEEDEEEEDSEMDDFINDGSISEVEDEDDVHLDDDDDDDDDEEEVEAAAQKPATKRSKLR